MDNIEENNKIIAEFMGGILETFEKGISMYVFPYRDFLPNSNHHWPHDKLHYHKFWDWLMPVVEKIENIDARGFYRVDCSGDACFITFEDETSTPIVSIPASVGKTKIGSTWQAVVEFIKLKNNKKNG